MTIEEIDRRIAEIEEANNTPGIIASVVNPHAHVAALRELRDLKQRLERLKELAPELTDDAVPHTVPELYAEYMALLGIGKDVAS